MNVMVNQGSIQNEIQKCENYVKEFAYKKAQIEKMVSDIENIWKKEDYEYFKEEMNQFMQELEGFKNQLDSYNVFVKGYLEAENALETEYSNKRIAIE